MRATIIICTIYLSLCQFRLLSPKMLFIPEMPGTLATHLLALWTVLTLRALTWAETLLKPFFSLYLGFITTF